MAFGADQQVKNFVIIISWGYEVAVRILGVWDE